MSLKIAVQMDPIENFHIGGDSTFALMLEAQNRGHELFYYVPQELSLNVSQLTATGYDVTVRDVEGDHFEKGEKRTVDLADKDVVLLRQDPPFDMSYITSTHLLETIHPKTFVTNDPAHVRNAPEKLFVMEYPEYMPETLISRAEQDIRAFASLHGDIIIKPLYGNGGAEIAGAINRVPAKGDVRSNMHAGGKPEPVEITARDEEICAAIGPALSERGLLFVGIDVIGGLMTEINVTSPTGIREVKKFGGNDIAEMIWDKIEEKI